MANIIYTTNIGYYEDEDVWYNDDPYEYSMNPAMWVSSSSYEDEDFYNQY